MGGEDGAPADDFRCLVEGEPLLLHQRSDPLEEQEGGMSLVDVIDAGADSQFLEKPNAAHPEEELLFDPRPRLGAVEALGDLSVLRRVP